jgi:hypothetical protein
VADAMCMMRYLHPLFSSESSDILLLAATWLYYHCEPRNGTTVTFHPSVYLNRILLHSLADFLSRLILLISSRLLLLATKLCLVSAVTTRSGKVSLNPLKVSLAGSPQLNRDRMDKHLKLINHVHSQCVAQNLNVELAGIKSVKECLMINLSQVALLRATTPGMHARG